MPLSIVYAKRRSDKSTGGQKRGGGRGDSWLCANRSARASAREYVRGGYLGVHGHVHRPLSHLPHNPFRVVIIGEKEGLLGCEGSGNICRQSSGQRTPCSSLRTELEGTSRVRGQKNFLQSKRLCHYIIGSNGNLKIRNPNFENCLHTVGAPLDGRPHLLCPRLRRLDTPVQKLRDVRSREFCFGLPATTCTRARVFRSWRVHPGTLFYASGNKGLKERQQIWGCIKRVG